MPNNNIGLTQIFRRFRCMNSEQQKQFVSNFNFLQNLIKIVKKNQIDWIFFFISEILLSILNTCLIVFLNYSVTASTWSTWSIFRLCLKTSIISTKTIWYQNRTSSSKLNNSIKNNKTKLQIPTPSLSRICLPSNSSRVVVPQLS